MAAKKRGLGRGLDALISTRDEVEALSEQPVHDVRDGTLRELPIEWIQRGTYQPRRDMSADALEELAASIRAQGVMQPVVVRPLGPESFELIAGERRWRAAQMAGLEALPAVVRDVADEDAIAMALIENIQRENLNPMEEAFALQRLQKEFELTQAGVADAVGKSRVTVTNLLRLISLEADVRRMLEHGDLEMGHARALLGLQGEAQIEAARQVVAKGMTVRQTEALVRQHQQGAPKPAAKAPADPNIQSLQDLLADRLGARVSINHGKRGKGKLVIQYSSLDELDGILNHIK